MYEVKELNFKDKCKVTRSLSCGVNLAAKRNPLSVDLTILQSRVKAHFSDRNKKIRVKHNFSCVGFVLKFFNFFKFLINICLLRIMTAFLLLKVVAQLS